MSYEKDPPPLADAGSEAPESLRALLRSARTDLPNAARLASLEAKLGPLLSGTAAPSTAPGMGALGKASLAVLGGLLVTGGVYLATRPAPEVPGPLPATEVREAAKPAAEPSPVAVPAAPPMPSNTEDAAKPSAEASPGVTRAEPGATRPSLVPEDQLLEKARRALASDPNRALALTREHARSYPKGVLAQEREVIAIEALKRLGRSSEADARRGTFEERYPQSAHRRNLEGTNKADAGK
jgi:outer membrane biosynthesis protein TonB